MSTTPRTGPSVASLMTMLAGKDGAARQRARKSLVVLGPLAIPSLLRALQGSPSKHLRWEAAKTLGAIGDARGIPALIQALDDDDSDVAWVAAEALRPFKKQAWLPLLRMLIKSGSDSVVMRERALHVLRNQKEAGFNELLAALRNALQSSSSEEQTPVAADDILKKLKRG